MNQGKLEEFGAYRKSRELFELVADDMGRIREHFELRKLISQQLASADSICANIEEGFGRQTKRDYAHFLTIARGSTRETSGRYERPARWLGKDAAAPRIALCTEIFRILTATIRTLRAE